MVANLTIGPMTGAGGGMKNRVGNYTFPPQADLSVMFSMRVITC
jgi:hypothetical protein